MKLKKQNPNEHGKVSHFWEKPGLAGERLLLKANENAPPFIHPCIDSASTSILLNRIVEKGGLMAACAKLYLFDMKKAGQFICECYEQCHNPRAINLWGEDLVSEIINFKHQLKQNEKTERLKQGC